MATLTRSEVFAQQSPESLLTFAIPTPFPVAERERLLLQESQTQTQAQQLFNHDPLPLREKVQNTKQEPSNEASVSAIHHSDAIFVSDSLEA
jgi:uncharacterized protein with von Willebrand factor type A (vWA) domain